MVTRYGMSEKLGTVLYGSEHNSDEVFLGRDFTATKAYSEETASAIDAEIRRIIEESYARCKAYISEHMDKLELVAGYLLKHEVMDGDIFKAAMDGDLTIEQLEEMEAEKQKKSEEENRRAEEERKAEEQEDEHPRRRPRPDENSVDNSDENDFPFPLDDDPNVADFWKH